MIFYERGAEFFPNHQNLLRIGIKVPFLSDQTLEARSLSEKVKSFSFFLRFFWLRLKRKAIAMFKIVNLVAENWYSWIELRFIRFFVYFICLLWFDNTYFLHLRKLINIFFLKCL